MSVAIEMSPGAPLAGTLLYREAEYSFAYNASDAAEVQRRAGAEGVTSLVADTLQLEVGVETGILLFAWGYLPAQSWIACRLNLPALVPGMLRVKELNKLEHGVSVSILRNAEWKAEFDEQLGLVRISVVDSGDSEAVVVADGVAVSLLDNQIRSIWLWPTFE